MVKNLSTIDRSERVRIGKHVPNEQAVNTIIINASSNVIEASQEGFYLAPIRVNEAMNSNAMCYDITTNEVVDSGKTLTFQGLSEVGNSTTETIQFTNNTTGFVTTSNVGIANTNPQHELSVGGDVYVEGNLTVIGETTAISSENLRVKDAIIELGENNTDGDFVFDLGLIMTRPGSNVTASYIESSNEYIIGYTQNSASDTYITPDASNLIQMRVYGDVTANSFIGDGSFLSNVIQDTDLDANLTVIRDEMAANTLTLRDDIQSNANVLRGEMAANTVTLRSDLQSNITISQNTMRSEMAANTVALRADLQSNATTLRGEMAANTVTLRNEIALKSNINNPVFTGIITGDGGAISNISLQHVTEYGNSTDQTITMSNTLSLITSGSVGINTPTPQKMLHVAGEILADDDITGVDFYGDDATFTGGLTVSGNSLFYGNLEVRGNTTYLSTQNLLVEDPILALAANNMSSSLDTGVVLVYQGESNVAFGYRGASNEFIISHTLSSPNDSELIPDTSNVINVHVYGNVTADKYIGDGTTLTGIALETDMISNVSRISVLETDLSSNATRVGVLETDLSSNATRVGVLETDLSSNASRVGVLETDLSSNATRVGVLETDLSSNATRVGVLETDLSSNATRVGVLETDLSSNASRVGVLETDLSSNASRINVLEQQGLSDIVNIGNVSSNTIQLTNADVGLKATGNVEAARFIGDGSHLTGLVTTLQDVTDNGNVSSNTIQLTNADVGLVATGNVEAARFIGDGSHLTGLVTDLQSVTDNGNVSSNTIQLTNADVGLVATGNVEAARFIGDGSHLTGLVTDLQSVTDNGNVSSNTIQLTNTDVGLKATGNVEAARFIGDGSHLTGLVTDLQSVVDNGNVSSNTIQLTNADVGLKATGNVEAARFIGDGSSLTGISFASNLEEIVLGGNVTSQTIHIQNTVSLTTTGNVGIANTNPMCDLAVGSNLCVNDISSNVLTVDGNILAHKLTLDSIQLTGGYPLQYVTNYGNTTSNTVQFTNSTTGLVTTANVGVANSNPIHTLDVGSNLWVDDTGSNVLYVNGNVHVAGSQLSTNGNVGIGNTAPDHNLSVGSNLYVEDTGSNVLVIDGNASINSTLFLGAVEISPAYTLEEVTGQGNVTSNVIQFTNADVGLVATGNVEAARFIGDGSHLTGLVTDLQSVVDNGNVSSNVVQFTNANVGAVFTGGIVINDGSYKCKHYAYSNVSVPTNFANVAMTFASNVFHAKITAQLTHGNEEVSTMILDVQGGTRNGTTSSLNIASGPGSVFGHNNTKPWSMSVGTTPTKVILEPSATGTTAYGIDLYVEYKSSSTDGKLESISIDADSVKSFVY